MVSEQYRISYKNSTKLHTGFCIILSLISQRSQYEDKHPLGYAASVLLFERLGTKCKHFPEDEVLQMFINIILWDFSG